MLHTFAASVSCICGICKTVASATYRNANMAGGRISMYFKRLIVRLFKLIQNTEP
jgi:hypothetical protein